MADWPLVRLEDIAADEKSAISKPYGSAMVRSDYVAQGIPVVRGVNLGSGRFLDDGFVFISEELADTMPGARLQPGDLVLTHRGSVGQVSMIPRQPKFDRYAVSTSQVKARLDPARALPEFYNYWFQSPAGRASILRGVSTVGVPGLARPVETVKALRVPLPPLPEQRRIAGVLEALDDLVEVNEQIVDSARRLSALRYRQAKQRVADVVRLGDVASVNQRQTQGHRDGEVTYVDIAALGDGAVSWPDPVAWRDAPSRARRLAKPGDTLWSTVRPNRRGHALLTHVPENLVVSTGIAVLTPGRVGPAEIFAATDEPEFVDYLMSRADGSAYPAVRGSVFEDAPIANLGAEASSRFEREVGPLWEAAGELAQEVAQLHAARDELLPLLMSGRVLVREVAA